MNMKKKMLGGAVVAASLFASAVTPEVTSVSMTQAVDSRLVTINYSLQNGPAVITLDIQTNVSGNVWASIGGENIQNVTGDVWKKVTAANGVITWRPDISWPDHKIAAGGARAVVTAWATNNTPDYMVVDISAGTPGIQEFYPAAEFVPGGVTNDAYKTSMLLMRKIMADGVRWTMGSIGADLPNLREAANEATHQVQLSGNYYIGVYEITQSQWAEATLKSVARVKNPGAKHPVDIVSFNEIRNTDGSANSGSTIPAGSGGKWPDPPSDDSFLGLLRLKTDIAFDLPSEAQWEFACRAGHGSGFWNDGSEIQNKTSNTAEDTNLDNLGAYYYNAAKVSLLTSDVGSFKPNSWGLYDMHGNVSEICLDWHEADISAHMGAVNIDSANPDNALSGNAGASRVIRGGAYNNGLINARPAYRGARAPNSRSNNGDIGFRVVCPVGVR